MYRVNYCETDPRDETTIINAQTREFGGWRCVSDTLEYIDQLMSGPMHKAEGKPGIIITRLQDEQATRPNVRAAVLFHDAEKPDDMTGY